jgi:hypothetical protein
MSIRIRAFVEPQEKGPAQQAIETGIYGKVDKDSRIDARDRTCSMAIEGE